LLDGQINFCFIEIMSSPGIENISLFQKYNQSYIHYHPVPLRGALAIVATRDGDAVDAEAATDERG
jgi:hypothetical protein